MPWWSWLLIWTVLVLGLFGMLAFFAWWLFRKLMAAAHEASLLLGTTEILRQRAEELREEAFRPAVLADVAVLRAEQDERRSERQIAKQVRRDMRVRRGKLLVKADPFRYAYLTQRS